MTVTLKTQQETHVFSEQPVEPVARVTFNVSEFLGHTSERNIQNETIS